MAAEASLRVAAAALALGDSLVALQLLGYHLSKAAHGDSDKRQRLGHCASPREKLPVIVVFKDSMALTE